MAWWSRGKRQARVASQQASNVLVISDIHLGEDILIEGPQLLNGYIRALNGTVMEFLKDHQNRRAHGLPWHLVINGDMFDFVKMPLDRQLSRMCAPGGEDEALYKLQRILRIHRPLFASLASFLLAGHKVTIIEGNHDAEFFFDGVRSALKEDLLRLADKQLRRRGETATAQPDLASRIAFSSWFVAEAGHYHIEHGHQYDQFCSFEHKLAPLESAKEAVLTQPMSHRILPKIAELMGNFSTHGIQSLRTLDFFRLARGLGVRSSLRLLYAYGALCALLFRQAGRKRQRELQAMAAMQAQKLAVLCADSCYSAGILRALDKLKATPAEYSLPAMLHLFWVDRLLVLATGVALAALWVTLYSASMLQAMLLAGFFFLAASLLSAFDAPPVGLVLRKAAACIAQVTGAQYVIFGHSHRPECINLREQFGVGRANVPPHYINGGSWVTREILRGGQSDGMTYVQITHEGAQLMQWRGSHMLPRCLHDLRDARKPPNLGVSAPSASGNMRSAL